MFDPSLLSPMAQQQPPWVPLETKDCSQGFCTIYCPQWCYILFPPPPPFFLDDDAASGGGTAFSPLVIAIIGILASAFVLVGYYAVVSKFCRRRRPRGDTVGPAVDEDVTGRQEVNWHTPPTVGLDEALINKITICRYRRGDGLVGCSDCSVCLGEFHDDERLRLLPKCSHAFHVQCIDTWLRSHSNCPLCRANIASVDAAPPQLPVASGDEMVVAVEDSDGGTGVENDTVIDPAMRRSFSVGSFGRSRVSVADILQVDMEDDHVGPVPMKRSVSSGRVWLTRQGRGSNAVLPI